MTFESRPDVAHGGDRRIERMKVSCLDSTDIKAGEKRELRKTADSF